MPIDEDCCREDASTEDYVGDIFDGEEIEIEENTPPTKGEVEI